MSCTQIWWLWLISASALFRVEERKEQEEGKMLSRLSSISSPLVSMLPSVLRQPILQKIVPASFSTSAALQFNSRLTSPHNFPQPRRQVKLKCWESLNVYYNVMRQKIQGRDVENGKFKTDQSQNANPTFDRPTVYFFVLVFVYLWTVSAHTMTDTLPDVLES